jgi:uncharacterized protein YecE (DUF72 family)
MGGLGLFDNDALPPPRGRVAPAVHDAPLQALARQLGQRWGGRLHLGTSSWHFPGWRGWVWAADTPADEALLSRHGLTAYARHPLLRCVSLDRAFYRPLDAAAYAALAAQVDDGFRFVVKAVAAVSDAQLREPGSGRALRDNPQWLDPATALGAKLGALVFQVSPLPARWLHDEPAWLARLDALLQAVAPPLRAAGATAAVELRDAALLTPALAALLRRHGARFVLGLHDRMPEVESQLPMLRAGWPGDLVCRWNLQRGQRYAQARDAWAPFDRLQSPDPATRATLVRVVRATLDAGHRVLLTVNNKAEGCAPATVRALAEALAA